MDREQKLKAAKEKLAKFQKKKSEKQHHHDPPVLVAAGGIPASISVDNRNPPSSSAHIEFTSPPVQILNSDPAVLTDTQAQHQGLILEAFQTSSSSPVHQQTSEEQVVPHALASPTRSPVRQQQHPIYVSQEVQSQPALQLEEYQQEQLNNNFYRNEQQIPSSAQYKDEQPAPSTTEQYQEEPSATPFYQNAQQQYQENDQSIPAVEATQVHEDTFSDHPEGGNYQEEQEPVYTEAEQYYYDLYVQASSTNNELSNRLQEGNMAYEEVRAELDSLSNERELLRSQISQLLIENSGWEEKLRLSVEEMAKRAQPEVEKEGSASEVEFLRARIAELEVEVATVADLNNWCQNEAVRLKSHEEYLNSESQRLSDESERLLLSHDQLSTREEAITATHQQNLELQEKLDQGKEWIRLQEVDVQTSQRELEEARLKFQEEKQGMEANFNAKEEESKYWIQYYQSKYQEVEFLNQQMVQEKENLLLQPPVNSTLPPADPSPEILSMLDDLKMEVQKSRSVEQGQLNSLMDGNRQILQLLQSSSVSQSTEFCRAIVEMSRTNNHLLSYISSSSGRGEYGNSNNRHHHHPTSPPVTSPIFEVPTNLNGTSTTSGVVSGGSEAVRELVRTRLLHAKSSH